MKMLTYYEKKRILKNPVSLCSFLFVIAFSLLLSITSLNQFYAFDGISKEGSGLQAIKIEKELDQKYGGDLTDEKVQRMLTDYGVLRKSGGVNPKYIYLNSFQSSAFAQFVDVDGNWNGQTVQDVYGTDFIQIGFVQGWLKTSSTLSMVLLVYGVVLIFLLSSVYAGEYGGMDRLILSCKYGRSKCSKAKVLASLQIALEFLFLLLVIHLGFAYVIYGKTGLNCSIQFCSIDFLNDYALAMTCLQLLSYQVLFAVISIVAIVGVTLFVSSLSQTSLISCLISIVLYVFPMLLPTTTNGLFETVCMFTPIHGLQFQTLLNKMEYSSFYLVLICFLIMILGVKLSERQFSKKEILQ